MLTIAKKFMNHEKDLIENVTKLRTKENQSYDKTDPNSIKDHISAAATLGSELGKVMISVEAYPELKSNETKSFSVGVYQVLIADLTLSFDNTIAVVAASKGNFHLMVIGLLLSVFLIATLASFFAEYIKRHMWLGYLGLFVILVISIQLIIGGLVSYEVLSINEKYKFLFL